MVCRGRDGETSISPVPRVSQILLLLPYPQVPPLLPSAHQETTARATQAGFLANPGLIPPAEGALDSSQEPRLLQDRCILSSPALHSRAPWAPHKAHSQPSRYTLHPGYAEGTAPQSGGSGVRRCGDRGGMACRHWRSWGCWGPGSHSGQSWPLSARCSWSAPRQGWCWCPAGRVPCRSASPAASGEDRARG